MSAHASFIYLTSTDHVVSAFTRNGAGDEKFDEEGLRELISDGLLIRHVRPSSLSFGGPTDRAKVTFNIPPSDLAVLNRIVEKPHEDPGLKRPRSFMIDDGEPKPLQDVPVGFKEISYVLDSDGVTVTLTPKTGGAIGADAVPIWTLLLLQPQGIFVSQRSEVPGTTVIDAPSAGTIPFAAIPSATHQLLLMIRNLHPIWDELAVGVKRTWHET